MCSSLNSYVQDVNSEQHQLSLNVKTFKLALQYFLYIKKRCRSEGEAPVHVRPKHHCTSRSRGIHNFVSSTAANRLLFFKGVTSNDAPPTSRDVLLVFLQKDVHFSLFVQHENEQIGTTKDVLAVTKSPMLQFCRRRRNRPLLWRRQLKGEQAISSCI